MSNANVTKGKIRNPPRSSNSKSKIGINKMREDAITIVLTTIPIPIEKPTKPERYSLLIGWKKVLRRRDREKNRKKALLISIK
jgi:hypothetical protein